MIDVDKYVTFEFTVLHVDYSPTSKNILAAIYQPPNSCLKSFIQEFQYFASYLSKLSLEINGTLILAGDFNINLHCVNNSLVADFIDCIYSNSLFPTVNYPIRITTNTAYLIDNIFINNSLLNLTGLLVSDISDHIPIFCFYHSSDRNRQEQLPELPKSFYKHINFFKVNQKLTAINWDFITLHSSVDDDYNEMLNIKRNVINSNFSLIKHKPKSAAKQPWLTAGLQNSCRVKNKM